MRHDGTQASIARRAQTTSREQEVEQMGKRLLQNTREPKGFGGWMTVTRMNGGHHAELAEWGLPQVSPRVDAAALDIGCGGGANVVRLLDMCPEGAVTGLDYSPVSVRKATRLNRRAIKEGRCTIVEGEVSALPFSDGTFDLITALETIYFWPDIAADFEEVLRVLAPGGTFLVCNEADGMNPTGTGNEPLVDGLVVYRAEEVEKLMRDAGFVDIATNARPERSWICVTAKKA